MENVVEGPSQEGQRKLAAAEAELADAERELEKASRDVEQAERDIKEALEEERRPHQFDVNVIYNGVSKKFEVRRQELVQQLLEQARNVFGPINNPHLLSLFNKAGVELKDDQTIRSGGGEAE